MKRTLLVLSLAGVVLLPAPVRAGEMSSEVRATFSDRGYRFCHELDYPLTWEEHDWCPVVGPASPSCPALPKACTLPPVAARVGHFGRLRSGKASSEPAKPREPTEDGRERPWDFNLHLPDMSAFARVLFFILLAIGIVVVVRAILRNLIGRRDNPSGALPAPPPPDRPEDARPAPGPVETDVERLLARARAAAERGDFACAIDDAYAALLRRLDGDGLIEIHPSRTNGDYVRRLRSRPPLNQAVRGIVRDVEDVQFGMTPPSERAFRAVLDRVVPLVARALAVASLFLGAGVALSCKLGDLGDSHADMSPSGTQAIVSIMKGHGFQIRHRVAPLTQLDRSSLTVVLGADTPLDEATWKHLLAWAQKGGVIVVAGVIPLPSDLPLRIVHDASPMINRWTQKPVPAEEVPRLEGVADWVPDVPMSMPGGYHLEPREPVVEELDGVVLSRGGVPVVTERRVGDGKILVMADGRLFTNVALTVPGNADFLKALLTYVTPQHGDDREVEICDGWTGLGAQTPFESVDQAKLTPVLLQLLLLLGLLFLWKGAPFARLRDPPVEGRRAFSDHVRAIGLAYRRARAGRHVEGLYAVWALDRLRERVHRSGRQGIIPLAEAIAARTGRPIGEIMAILVEAATAREDPPPSVARREREGDLNLMRNLMSFLTATGQRSDGPQRRHPQ